MPFCVFALFFSLHTYAIGPKYHHSSKSVLGARYTVWHASYLSLALFLWGEGSIAAVPSGDARFVPGSSPVFAREGEKAAWSLGTVWLIQPTATSFVSILGLPTRVTLPAYRPRVVLPVPSTPICTMLYDSRLETSIPAYIHLKHMLCIIRSTA